MELAQSRPAVEVDAPLISVIVPSFNAAHHLKRSLPPLLALRDQGEVAEVLVVDDRSTESTNVETAERLGATVIRAAQNGGPGAARNVGARAAVGDILWFVDADVIAHDTGPTQLRRAFLDPGVGAVFGSYDDRPPAANFASTYKNLVHRYYHQRGKTDSETFWAGCGAVRKRPFLEAGGFDVARYKRPSIEDIELGYRMKKRGWSIRLVPTLLGTHLKTWSLKEVARTDIFQRAIPWSRLILAGEGPSDDLNVSSVERLKAAAAGLWLASAAASLVPPLWPWAPLAFLALTLLVAALNASLIRFFAENRGFGFALRAAAYHQVYYVYSAVTFVLCAAAHYVQSGDARKPARTPT